MADDPYTPPESAVADRVPDRMVAERPWQVRRAVWLLWISYALAFPLLYLEVERSPDGGALAVGAVLLAIGAALNVNIWRGANWARITYLALFAVSFLAFWFAAGDMLTASVFEFLLNAANSILDAIAMFLIFTPPGSLWFRKVVP